MISVIVSSETLHLKNGSTFWEISFLYFLDDTVDSTRITVSIKYEVIDRRQFILS